jgi:hypothetical protein
VALARNMICMDNPGPPRLSDEFFAVIGLLAPLLVPLGLIGIGQHVFLGLAQSRELLRNLLAGSDQGLHVFIFFVAYAAWLLLCRELALTLLQPSKGHAARSPRVAMLATFCIRLIKLGVVAVAIDAAFSVVKGEGTTTSLWPMVQLAFVAAGIVLAAFSIARMRTASNIPLVDVALPVLLIFLITSFWSSWLTPKPAAPTIFGSSVPFWIPLLCAIIGTTLQAFASITGSQAHRPWAVSIGLLLIVIAVVTLPLQPSLWLAMGFAGVFPGGLLFDWRWPGEARSGWKFVISALIGFAVFGLIFTGFPAVAGKWLGSMAILFIGLGVWSAFVASIWCAIIFRQRALGVTVAVSVAIMMSGAIDHRLRASLPNSGVDQRPKIHDHYAAWKKTLPDPEASPIFVVAASGGGLRAAYWTALTLAKLDDATCGQFSRHVYAYSGVSGGSLGVAAFEAQRAASPKNAGCEPLEGTADSAISGAGLPWSGYRQHIFCGAAATAILLENRRGPRLGSSRRLDGRLG